jgi:hypothetical protein
MGLHYRQQRRFGRGVLHADKSLDGIHPAAGSCTHHGYRRVQGLGQREGVQIAFASGQKIGHVHHDQCGQFVGDHLARQRHLAMQLGGIQNQQNGLGTRLALNLASQRAHRDALVFRRQVGFVAFQAPYAG